MDSTLNETKSEPEVTNLNVILPPFSYATFRILEIWIHMVATGIITLMGIVSNLINFIVFYRQGIFTSSSTVLFTGISITDFIGCTIFMLRIFSLYAYHFFEYYPSSSYSLSLFFGYQYDQFFQMSVFFTTYMTVERAICVCFPFHAKTMFTPMRSLIVVIAIVLLTIFLNFYLTVYGEFGWMINPANNKTYLGYYLSSILSVEFGQAMGVCYIAFRFSSIILVIASNIVIFWKVKLSKKFRKSTGVSSSKLSSDKETTDDTKGNLGTEDDQKQTKDMKLLRMIVVMSLVFTGCYIVSIPYTVLVKILLMQYHYYVNFVIYEALTLIENINATTNIIIYYRMSSRYKEEFRALFGLIKAK